MKTLIPHQQDDNQIKSLQQDVAKLKAAILEKDRIIKELYNADNILDMLVRNIPNQVFWKNHDLIYLGCNKAFADVTGMSSPSEVIGKTDFDFHRDPAHAESYRAWDRKIIDSGKAVLDIEEAYHCADGREGTVLTSKVPLKNSDGQVFGILGICTDITERKEMESKHTQLIRDLEGALSKVKTLSGLIPICSNCKGIRDDKGYWKKLEIYISEHSNANFTHSICPECIKELYPESFKSKNE